jgi:hypothetical protein
MTTGCLIDHEIPSVLSSSRDSRSQMIGHLTDICGIEIEIVILFNPKISDLNMLSDEKTGVFQRFGCTSNGAAIDADEQLACPGGLNHPADMAADASQAEVSPHTPLRQLNGRLVCDLTHIGTASTREN